MRDVRDWNKYVDLVSRTVSKRVAVPPKPSPEPHEEQADGDENGVRAESEGEAVASGDGATDPPRPARKGRGPRREETREELIARLIDPTISLEETARILEVCPTTVRRYTNKGILPHYRSAGNQRRFKLSTVLEFEKHLRSGRDEPGASETSAAD